ncbi:hypothetical protein F4819DRAFT_483239 [Hypoxylon fuscum]|nr:hypothetical protein F4819DRAFT_483239 [Hypoxylon fuscum]
MFITIFLLLPLLALLVTGNNTYALGTGDPSTLPAISPPFDYEGSIEKGLQESLPLTQFTIDYFSHGEIPQDCKDRAKDHYNASDFEVFSVTYEDCGQPWIMCRLKSANVSADTMATTFGQMPLGMREFVKHVMVVKPEALPGAAAISSGDTIMVTDESYRLFIFAHEMSHSIDSHQEVPWVTPPGKGGLSISKHWQDEYSEDNATISGYARSSWSENLAETGIVALFHNVVPNGVHALAHDPSSVYHQYATYQTAYRDIITPTKERNCTHRQRDSPLVHVDDDAVVFEPPANHTRFKVGITLMSPGVFQDHTCVLPSRKGINSVPRVGDATWTVD